MNFISSSIVPIKLHHIKYVHGLVKVPIIQHFPSKTFLEKWWLWYISYTRLPLMQRRILKVSKMEGGRKLFKNSLNRMLLKNESFNKMPNTWKNLMVIQVWVVFKVLNSALPPIFQVGIIKCGNLWWWFGWTLQFEELIIKNRSIYLR